MKRLTNVAAPGILLVGLSAGLAFLAFALAGSWAGGAAADPPVSVGVDTSPYATPANQAMSLGTIERCTQVANGATFDVDIYVKDVPPMRAFAATFNYQAGVLRVEARNVQMFLAGSGGNVLDLSDPTVPPDTDGYYGVGAFDTTGPHENGSGVLVRLTLKAVGTGVSPAALTMVNLWDPDGTPIPPVGPYGFFVGPILNGQIAVGQPCPDTDHDTVPDTLDNCPLIANADQADADADGVGNVCDACPSTAPGSPADTNGCSQIQLDQDLDGICDPGKSSPLFWCIGSDNCPATANQDQADGDSDGVGDVCDNCPIDSNPDQAKHDSDPYGDACDIDDDNDGYIDTAESYYVSDSLNLKCYNAVDDDSDTKVNDGCPKMSGAAESGTQCDNTADDDSDGMVNDGCPQVGAASESSNPEVCDGVDNDLDGSIDEGYDRNPVNGNPDCFDNVDTDGDMRAESGTECTNNLDDDSDMKTNDGCPAVGAPETGAQCDYAYDDDTDGAINDGCPTAGSTNPGDEDDDGDGFWDIQEHWCGTDSLDACPDNTLDPAWPPDFNNNRSVNALDIARFGSVLGAHLGGTGPKDHKFDRRFDLKNDGNINSLDVSKMRPGLLASIMHPCTN